MANGNLSPQNEGCKLQPFQRNRYFYGKLMMVRDFEAEQSYLNGKRHLINQLIHGHGVVCGLRADATVGTSRVTISAGVALDCCGRELVVANAFTVESLAKLKGYQASRTLDLCIGATNCLSEPVAALAKDSTCEEVCQYNRIAESFEFSLREPPSGPAPPDVCNMGLNERSLLAPAQSTQFTLSRLTPRWINPRDVFEVRLRVIAHAAAVTLKLVVTENLPASMQHVDGLDAQGRLTISAANVTAGQVIEKSYLVRGPAAAATVNYPVSALVSINDAPAVPAQAASSVPIEVIEGSLLDQLASAWFAERRNKCPECADGHAVAIARVTLDASGNLSAALLPMPGSDYVYDNALLFDMLACASQRLGQMPGLLSVFDNGAVVKPIATALNFLPGFTITDGGPNQANIAPNVGNGIQVVGDQVQPQYDTAPTAGRVCQANDPRLSNARPPLPHAATHADGGPDEINVQGLSGVLAQAQRLEVQHDGAAVATRTRVNFTGPGVAVADNSGADRVDVAFTGGGGAAPAVAGRVSLSTNADGFATAAVDTGLGHSRFCVVLGLDSGETVEYGDLTQFEVRFLARVIESPANMAGSFELNVRSGPNRRLAIKWNAIPTEERVRPTLTLPTLTIVPTLPTLTLPPTIPTLTLTPTVFTPTLTRPTLTATIVPEPTLLPTRLTLTATIPTRLTAGPLTRPVSPFGAAEPDPSAREGGGLESAEPPTIIVPKKKKEK